jgi:hypothetical protein
VLKTTDCSKVQVRAIGDVGVGVNVGVGVGVVGTL